MPRKLVCFLVADAVGYSARVEANEAEAIAALSATLSIIEEAVARHGGTTLARAGDSVIATFETSVAAVTSALDIQKGVDARDEDVLSLRIGLHFGDVSEKHDTLLGDGLNIAARLEPLAPEGGILITSVVADQIVGKIDAQFAPIGKQRVKNISRPLELFCWPADAARRYRRRKLAGRWPYAVAALALCGLVGAWVMTQQTGDAPAPLRDVVAVLRFQNPGGTPDDRAIADGLAQDLTIRLAEVSGVGVVPSSLVFSVTDHGLEAIGAAQSLGARYVVDGTVRLREEDLRIAVELIDGAEGTIVWADAYDGALPQLVEFRDQIVEQIVGEISGQITKSDLDRLRNTGTENPDAYRQIILGRQAAASLSREATYVAERHFRQAINLDPDYARAYAELAAIYAIRIENGWTVLSKADEEKSLYFAEKALSIDPDLWLAHYAAGRLYSILSEGDFTQAEHHLERAMMLQPANDDARIYLAAVKIFQGKADEAVRIVQPVVATHPHPPFWYYLTLGNALFHVGNYEAAERAFDDCLTQMPSSPYCLRFQIANYGAMGRVEDAEWLLEEYAFLGFDTSLASIMDLLLLEHPEYRANFESALRAAGVGD
ncbi:adenylate/guanylate cyclase domain-containing protein [Lutimaribacter marinistellae]|uniref:Adenylate/guanylate cyclase domain-containing protein n=1 Tax=Lutimaribacter marinistellae TaxID=1820329 RepID=A0ABV7TFI5_9RHOB